MNDKEPYAFFGEALLPAGFNLALVEYTLAPTARLDQIVAEVRAAVAWVIDHAAEHGGDARRVFVAGHSAGGHLTAAAMSDPRVAGGHRHQRHLRSRADPAQLSERQAGARRGRGDAQ